MSNHQPSQKQPAPHQPSIQTQPTPSSSVAMTKEELKKEKDEILLGVRRAWAKRQQEVLRMKERILFNDRG